jgi:7 transmembrane receptor (rhodopsin family).
MNLTTLHPSNNWTDHINLTTSMTSPATSEHLFSTTTKNMNYYTDLIQNTTVYKLTDTILTSHSNDIINHHTVFTTISTTNNGSTDSTFSTLATSPKFSLVEILLCTAFVLIFIIGVTGNALVCYYFKFSSTSLHGMAKLIYYLAVVDLLASVINPTLYMYWQVTFNRKWHFGFVGCKIIPALAKSCITISLGIILLITIERCIVICRPFHSKIKDKHINLAVIGIIIYAVLCETPQIMHIQVHPKFTCVVSNLRVDSFFYPTIIIYIARDMFFLATFVVTVASIYVELYNKESAATLREQQSVNKNKKVMHMLVTLAVVFILLVFPREILHIVYMMSWKFGTGIPHTETILNVNAFLKVLHMCNSVVNVFIYAGLQGRFRHKVFSCLFRVVGKSYQTTFLVSDSVVDSQQEKTVQSSFLNHDNQQQQLQKQELYNPFFKYNNEIESFPQPNHYNREHQQSSYLMLDNF